MRFGRLFATLVACVATACTSLAAGYSVKILDPTNDACVKFSAAFTVTFSGPLPYRVTMSDDMGNQFYNQFWVSPPPPTVTVLYDRLSLGVPDGHHLITITVSGSQGIVQDSIYIRADWTAPVPDISSPGNGEFVSGVVAIEGSLTDNYSGAGDWSVWIDGVQFATGQGVDIVVPWDTSNLEGGSTHTIVFKGCDACDNNAVSAPIQVRIGARIYGHVDLGGYRGRNDVVEFFVRIKRDGMLQAEMPTVLDADGNYSVITTSVGPGADIILKPWHWLASKVENQVVTGTMQIDMYFPYNGDADNDNTIGIFDINQILTDWALPTIHSDLDGSGQTDIYDLNTILLNFGLVGDE